jgi:hypothetical protein
VSDACLLPFRELPDACLLLFEIEATNGMSRASINKLLEISITEEYKRDVISKSRMRTLAGLVDLEACNHGRW